MSDVAGEAQPDLAIRTKPPSPKRLSKHVLWGGAIILGLIIAGALLIGLSDTGPNYGRDQEAIAASAGPPDSIQSASANYESFDLAGHDGLSEGGGDTLAAPQGQIWAEPAPNSASTPPAPARAEPDPQTLARAAPILFETNANRAAASERNDDRLDTRLTPPRSAYELLSGAVIPAALMTELNSDLPGRVIAQVTGPVFDSVTGRHLLIPQGARLIGTYDNGVRYGDRRMLLVWNRLILPDGWSINLQAMQGGDATGAAGLSDRADQHLDRLLGAIGLSAIVSVVANTAEEDEEEGSFSESVADAAAQEAAQSGGRILDREMSVRPTLRVRAGAPVRVLVMRDIQLRPYRARFNGP